MTRVCVCVPFHPKTYSKVRTDIACWPLRIGRIRGSMRTSILLFFLPRRTRRKYRFFSLIFRVHTRTVRIVRVHNARATWKESKIADTVANERVLVYALAIFFPPRFPLNLVVRANVYLQTRPLIVARKSEFIHTRAITYIHTTNTPRMKRYVEKKN